MKNIPFDYFRCNPKSPNCTIKETCARYTSPGEGAYQWFADVSKLLKSSNDNCQYFIDNCSEDDCNV